MTQQNTSLDLPDTQGRVPAMRRPRFPGARLASKGLGRRIVTLMILASAVLSLCAAVVQLYFSYRSDLDRAMNELTTVETRFLSGLENALWQFNLPQVGVLLDGIVAQADITSVTLTSQSGQVLERGSFEEGASVRMHAFPLIHNRPDGTETKVGLLEVTLSLSGVHARLWQSFLTLLASNFAKTLAASVLMLLIFDRMVARHLRHVSAFVSRPDWDAGEHGLALDRSRGHADDELTQITSALNASRERIQASRAERSALSDSLQAILNAVTSGIFVFDASGQIAILNPQGRLMFEEPDAALPMAWPEDIRFLDRKDMSPLDPAANPVKRALSGQVIMDEIAALSRPNGNREPRYVKISSAVLSEGNALGLRVMLIIEDSSQQELNRQQSERAGRLDALGQLTGGVAHDFNNLLATISYGLELARNSENEDKRQVYLGAALESVERGADLTKRLLAFAKRQPGMAKSKAAGEVLRDLHGLVKPLIEERIDLQLDPDTEEGLVFCDIAQLENALLNLVINARDAIRDSDVGSKIVIRARSLDALHGEIGAQHDKTSSTMEEGDHANLSMGDLPPSKTGEYIEFSVSDDGPGMMEEVRRRAVDPFFTTKSDHSGTGLGLSIVYGFVQQSYGLLRVYSEPGQGTTVRMFLPRGAANGVSAPRAEVVHKASSNGECILIVENEPHLLDVLGEMVASFGYQVIVAESGDAAAKILASERRVDCLLTDVIMPGPVGGFSLAAEARRLRPEIPVIFMSGYAGFSKEELRQVAAPMVNKPATPRELSLALRAALDPTSAARSVNG